MAMAGAVFVSAIVINPWSGRFYRQDVVNFYDVMSQYFMWALLIGFLLMIDSFLLRWFTSESLANLSLLFLTLAVIFLSDRLVLAYHGLPLWVADFDNHYKHRPDIERTWGNGKLIRINGYGYHDDDFPPKKESREFRAVMLGDSITMGHGVSREETFSNRLEALLRATGRRPVQIINAGVQGYATFQEYNSFVASLEFEPDFIVVGFCMNDLAEPFVVQEQYGGTGFDYHGITQARSAATSYLLNETGYGRLIQSWRDRHKSVELSRRWQLFNVKEISRTPLADSKYAENWRVVLADLDRIYALARLRNVPILLLLFPYTFQLSRPDFQEPQRILKQHAASRRIDVIDFTELYEKKVFDAHVVEFLTEKGFTDKDIDALYLGRIRKFFLDEDHFTSEGHNIVASVLYDYILQQHLF